MASLINLLGYFLFACTAFQAVYSADPKMVIYWGQNSAGGEKPLRNYCEDSSYDIIVVGFVYLFPSASGNADPTLPGMNFANHCEVPFNSANPYVLNCTANVAPDITYCQQQGKTILLSFGGGVGTYGFSSDSQAITFANTVWNMFLGGSDSNYIRPFGTAIFDGVDLDIEGGAQTGYISFISTLRNYFASAPKTYYISSAPQCFYPDRLGPGAGTPLQDGWFDYIWIQFYNNHCGLDEPANFNWATWASSMKSAANPNVKLFIGAPASPIAAGSGFVDLVTLQSIASTIGAAYPDIYGGIMMWDASTSDLNSNFAVSVASFVHASSSAAPAPISLPSTTAAKLPSTTAANVPSTTSAMKPSTTASNKPSTTGLNQPSTTGSSSPSSSPVDDSSCVSGNMKCLSASSFSTCNHNAWAAPQFCANGLQCSPSGDYIYCVPSAALPISASPAPISTPMPPASTPVSTPTPVVSAPSTTGSVSAPTPIIDGSCSLGYQICVGDNSYQTCGNGRDGPVWAGVQFCQAGLSCHSSTTANNIYCY